MPVGLVRLYAFLIPDFTVRQIFLYLFFSNDLEWNVYIIKVNERDINIKRKKKIKIRLIKINKTE